MRRWFFVLGLLGSLNAQAESPVWAIRGPHNTVYLAGSVHLLKADQATLPAAFDRAYAAAKSIVMEVDIDEVESDQAQSLMLEKGMLGNGATLRQTLGETRYSHLAAAAQRLGLPLEGLEAFQPWAIALTLAQLQYLQLGLDPEQGVESQLGRRAHADGKEIRGLETLAEQLNVLAGLSMDDQARFLDLTVDEMGDADRETREVLSAWRAGDNAKLAHLLSADYERFPSLYRALVTDRNRRWMPQIERLLNGDQDCLIVVGALHLVGDGGLLDLAKARGFTPRQLQ